MTKSVGTIVIGSRLEVGCDGLTDLQLYIYIDRWLVEMSVLPDYP